jgi:hypothetical protein
MTFISVSSPVGNLPWKRRKYLAIYTENKVTSRIVKTGNNSSGDADVQDVGTVRVSV